MPLPKELFALAIMWTILLSGAIGIARADDDDGADRVTRSVEFLFNNDYVRAFDWTSGPIHYWFFLPQAGTPDQREYLCQSGALGKKPGQVASGCQSLPKPQVVLIFRSYARVKNWGAGAKHYSLYISEAGSPSRDATFVCVIDAAGPSAKCVKS